MRLSWERPKGATRPTWMGGFERTPKNSFDETLMQTLVFGVYSGPNLPLISTYPGLLLKWGMPPVMPAAANTALVGRVTWHGLIFLAKEPGWQQQGSLLARMISLQLVFHPLAHQKKSPLKPAQASHALTLRASQNWFGNPWQCLFVCNFAKASLKSSKSSGPITHIWLV